MSAGCTTDSASELTAFQAASLAATLPHPLTSNPDHQPGRMAWRRDLILQRIQGGDRSDLPPIPSAPEPADPGLPDVIDVDADPIPPPDAPPGDTVAGDPAAIDTTVADTSGVEPPPGDTGRADTARPDTTRLPGAPSG